MVTNRNVYWDVWKGLAIVGVVLIHATTTAFEFPRGSLNYNFGLSFRQIINFSVPLFFAFSGYFSAISRSESAIAYYKSRVSRIVPPYILWTMMYLLVRNSGGFPALEDIVKAFVLGTGIGIGYFVVVLLQYIALTPLLLKIKSFRLHLFICFFGAVFGLAFTYYYRLIHPNTLFGQFPGSAILFFVWYPFYHLGLLFGLYRDRLVMNKISVKAVYLLVAMALGLSILEAYIWSYSGHDRLSATQLKASSFFFSLSVLIFVFRCVGSARPPFCWKWLSWLGCNSFGIYLVHLLALEFVRSMPFVGALYAWQPFYVLFTSFLTLSLCSLFIYALSATGSARFKKIVLG